MLVNVFKNPPAKHLFSVLPTVVRVCVLQKNCKVLAFKKQELVEAAL